MDSFPGRPGSWRVPLVEIERVESDDPGVVLGFLDSLGLSGASVVRSDEISGEIGVGILLGARACAQLGGVPEPAPSPAAVPECVAVAYRRGAPATVRDRQGARLREWACSWTDDEHAEAVEAVRQEIARGGVYQANVVGHRSASYEGDPAALAAAVASIGAPYGGTVAGEGWAVGSASPEQVVRVVGDRVTTVPIKGTSAARETLLASAKDRAEHVMIVDLERNDLARVTEPGTVVVDDLYAVAPWAGLWHASSTVSGRLIPGVSLRDVLRAVLPGGSVTGAPKHAACRLLAELEPVGRGPAMGAFGFVWSGGMDLGLTIRSVAAANGRAHLWAGGGITWGSEPAAEVAEAHAKAAPLVAALDQVRPCSS